jgi:L-asparaginase
VRERKVLIITTGGTIAGKVAINLMDYKLRKGSDHFTAVLGNAIDSIKNITGIDVKLELLDFCDFDSSDILPKHWSELATIIKNNYDNYDAFIITHGTNTMGYTSAALSFALPNLDKPIIITGSQVPSSLPGSDAILT